MGPAQRVLEVQDHERGVGLPLQPVQHLELELNQAQIPHGLAKWPVGLVQDYGSATDARRKLRVHPADPLHQSGSAPGQEDQPVHSHEPGLEELRARSRDRRRPRTKVLLQNQHIGRRRAEGRRAEPPRNILRQGQLPRTRHLRQINSAQHLQKLESVVSQDLHRHRASLPAPPRYYFGQATDPSAVDASLCRQASPICPQLDPFEEGHRRPTAHSDIS
jgi:hypothetical protein